MDESGEHDIELVEAREDPPEALESAEQALDLVSAAVEQPIETPRMTTRLERRNDGV